MKRVVAWYVTSLLLSAAALAACAMGEIQREKLADGSAADGE